MGQLWGLFYQHGFTILEKIFLLYKKDQTKKLYLIIVKNGPTILYIFNRFDQQSLTHRNVWLECTSKTSALVQSGHVIFLTIFSPL